MTQSDTPLSEVALKLIEQFLEALTQQNLSEISACLTEDVSLIQPLTFSGQSDLAAMFHPQGKVAVLEYFKGVFTNFAQVRFIEQEITVSNSGDIVFIEALGALRTRRGDLLYHNRYVFKFKLKNGLFQTIREYANPVTASQTLGIPLGQTGV